MQGIPVSRLKRDTHVFASLQLPKKSDSWCTMQHVYRVLLSDRAWENAFYHGAVIAIAGGAAK